MPITRELTPDELQGLENQGIDSSAYKGKQVTLATDDEVAQQSSPPVAQKEPIGKLQTVGRTAKAHVGGYLGGAGGLALSSWLLGPEVGLPTSLIVGGLSAAGGAYGGQKLQDVAQGDELTQRLQQEAQEGEEANPNTALATDVIGSAVAGGGKPNLSNIGKALTGNKQALAKLAIGSVVNPAINTGIDLATTGQLPTGRDLVGQVAGGALFSEPSALGRMMHGGGKHVEINTETPPIDDIKTTPEPTDKGVPIEEQKPDWEATSPEEEQQKKDWAKRFGKPTNDEDTTIAQGLQNDENKKVAATNAHPVEEDSTDEQLNAPDKISDNFLQSSAHNAKISVNDFVKKVNENLYAPSDDRKTYDDLKAKFQDMMQKGQTSTPEFQETWKQIEDLKNKNGGMPPSAEGNVNAPNNQTETPEFKEWFGESRVIDLDGNPLVVYHGSHQNDWTIADTDKGKQTNYGKGVYFSNKPRIANEYAGNVSGSSIKPAYIKIEKPRIIDRRWKNYSEPYGYSVKDSDGTIIYNRNNKTGQTDTIYHVKNPEQIKSAIGNKGTFDSKNKSIVHSSTINPKGWEEISQSDDRPKQIALEQHIRTGTATTGSVLQHLSGMDNEFAPLAKHMLENASPEKLVDKVKFSGSPQDAYYNIPSKVTRVGSERITPYVIMHEMGHSLISNNLPPEFNGLTGSRLKVGMDAYLADPKGNPHIKELIQTYYEAAKGLKVHDLLFNDKAKTGNIVGGLAGAPREAQKVMGDKGYAMSTLHEFTTMGLSHPEFQKKLNELPSGKSNSKSLWSRFVDSVRGILGVPVKERSLLERALKVNEELIKMPRTEVAGEGNLHAPAKSGTKPDDETRHMGWLGNTTRSMIDKIRDIKHPSATELADSFHKALNTAQELNGRWTNKIVEAGKKLTAQDKETFNKIADYENLSGKQAPSSMFKNVRVREFYNIERKLYDESGKHQLSINEPVMRNGVPSKLIQKSFAHPTTLRPEVDEVIKKNTDQPAIAKLGKDFVDNQIAYGKTPIEATKQWEDFKSNLQGNAFNGAANMQHYNAVRREQGVPLPKSFQRLDPVENLQYYYNRRATDNAFYEHVESNPKAMAALGQTKDAWQKPIAKSSDGSLANNPTVQKQLREFQGEKGTPGAHNENAASALATTLLISQPGLEVHKVGSNLITALTGYVDNPVQMGRVLGAMVKNFTSGLQTAKENGVIKFNAKSFSDVFKETSTAADRLQALAQGVRNVSSIGGLTDKFSAGLMQAGLEAAVPMKINAANNGNESAQQLMRRIDPDYKVGKKYSDTEVGKLASRLAGYIHGTGDGRTMPAWMTNDTELSGFFKLAHWSVSQTNRFMTDVWTPATKGNYAPLITSMFGGVIGGYVIKQIREELQGKKGQIPSLSEIGNSEGGFEGNKPLLAYNAIAAAQYAGFGGLLSQIAKYPFDIIYKNSPQGATFPLDQAASDIVKTASEVGTAIANDPKVDYLELASHVFGHLLSSNVGLARVGLNQAINNGLITGTMAEKKELSDKLGQLRRFDMVSGLPYDTADTAANPYMNLEQKKFKMEQDPQKAVAMIPGLVQTLIKKYGDKPDVLLSKLKGLKENEYATFPSLESTPLSFTKYLMYLKKEEGPEAAQAALEDYFKHRLINEMKGSVVP